MSKVTYVFIPVMKFESVDKFSDQFAIYTRAKELFMPFYQPMFQSGELFEHPQTRSRFIKFEAWLDMRNC